MFPYRWYGRRSYCQPSKENYPGIKRLSVPESYKNLDFNNLTFPDLEELEIDEKNAVYHTDGKMLYLKKASSWSLLLALCAGMREETVVIPKQVRTVENRAFSGTVCRHIIFENPDIKLERDAFADSVWLKEQDNVVYIGSLLYRIKKGFKEESLIVDEKCSRFDQYAFREAVPSKIVTPVVPSVKHFNQYGRSIPCQSLTVTGSNTRVNFKSLRQWERLKEVHFVNHRKYKDIDGVVFSANGRALLFYPPARPETAYRIPDGVMEIGAEAFCRQQYLKKVTMPDSVKTIRQGAFNSCKELVSVKISEGVREIMDANVFSPLGLFAGCSKLEEVTLPTGLLYIGAWAFSHTALKTIDIPPKVTQIGTYAFANTPLDNVKLPRSCHLVGKGAFCSVESISAYEGTAKGLIPGLEAVFPGESDKIANLQWHEAYISMLGKNGALKDTVWIPKSLKHAAASFIDAAWNNDAFDYGEYYSCFENIQDKNEKLEFAAHASRRLGDISGTEFERYFRRTAKNIAVKLIEKNQEKELVDLLRKDYLSDSALDSLLDRCSRAGLTTAAAYILQKKRKNGTGKRKTAAIRL